MLSQTVEYALRACVMLAQESGRAVTTAQLARHTKVPAGYLAKVLQLLVRGGIVSAVRGVKGGHQLQRPAAELTILEIVATVDPIRRIVTCPLGLPQHGKRLCPLHRRLDTAMALTEKVFGDTTLQDLVNESREPVPACRGLTASAPAAAGAKPRKTAEKKK